MGDASAKLFESQIVASGEAVGLPPGQMGNSEVGHTNIGAGRVVYQDLVRINRATEVRRCEDQVASSSDRGDGAPCGRRDRDPPDLGR